MKQETIVIEPHETDLRIDAVLSNRFSDYSRSYFQYLIEEGFIESNSLKIKKREKLKEGSEVLITFAHSQDPKLEPEEMDLDILYEDDDIIAINKPSGIVVHPGAGNLKNTLVAGLLHYLKSLPESDDPLRPGIVHRLDKETSGVIIVAKTRLSHMRLVESFKNRTIQKTYVTVTYGRPIQTRVDMPIGRHPIKREQMTIRLEGGKEAVTEFYVIKSNQTHSLVIAKPITGRTHQIRVHLKSLRTPIVGDHVYGKKEDRDTPLCLHALKISFNHPITGDFLTISAPLPTHFSKWKNILNPHEDEWKCLEK